jgi:hypothetical protein
MTRLIARFYCGKKILKIPTKGKSHLTSFKNLETLKQPNHI